MSVRRWLMVVVAGITFAWSSAGAAPTVVLSRVSGPSPLAQVSCDRDPDTEDGAAIAMDPADPQHIVASWGQDGWLGIVVAATKDGGATWVENVLPGEVSCATPIDNVVNERVAIGPDGTAYAVTLPEGVRASGITPIYAYSSPDGGFTWGSPVTVSVGIPQDFPSIAVAPDKDGTAYIIWSARYDATMISRTTDGGATWSAPHLVRVSSPGYLAFNRLAALSGDRLVLTYLEGADSEFYLGVAGKPAAMMAIRSSDGGSSWSAPVLVSATAGVDVAATASGEVYAVTESSDVLVARSDDGGATWSDPTLVAVQHPCDCSLPSASIAATDAHVVVLYNDVCGSGICVHMASSSDRGTTWTDNVIVGPVTENSSYAFGGHQIASIGGRYAVALLLGGPDAVNGPTDIYVAHASFTTTTTQAEAARRGKHARHA